MPTTPAASATPAGPDAAPALTDAEKRTRRQRSIALAVALGGLVVLFYVVTIAKLGANAVASHL